MYRFWLVVSFSHYHSSAGRQTQSSRLLCAVFKRGFAVSKGLLFKCLFKRDQHVDLHDFL